MREPPEIFARYPATAGDEAMDPTGRPAGGYAVLGPLLAELGAAGLAAAAERLVAERNACGMVAREWADGRQRIRPIRLDPLPRVVESATWARLAAGVEQRHRALNAFLADAYRRAGRRRGDPDAERAPEIVRAGVVPAWAVAHSPGRAPDAVGLAWPGQPRSAVAAVDLLRTSAGNWVARADHLQVPAGLGVALANRSGMAAALPSLAAAGRAAGLVDPWVAIPLLRRALREAAPPGCPGAPRMAILSAGEGDSSWFEHRLLADALDVPLVTAGDLWPRVDGGIEAAVDGQRMALDVLYRRFPDAELPAHGTPTGQSLSALLHEAVRAGRLGMANVPGNGLADDAAIYAFVPNMIRFYLGEEPLLPSVPTWVLADEQSWRQVRSRLHELVLTPVDGYGGGRRVVGPACSPAELAQLQAEVAAAPHRFVAQEPQDAATVPVLVEGRLLPAPAELRIFSVAVAGTTALPAPLTRIGRTADASPDAGRPVVTKDTWLLG